jgi:hypothetical protein
MQFKHTKITLAIVFLVLIALAIHVQTRQWMEDDRRSTSTISFFAFTGNVVSALNIKWNSRHGTRGEDLALRGLRMDGYWEGVQWEKLGNDSNIVEIGVAAVSLSSGAIIRVRFYEGGGRERGYAEIVSPAAGKHALYWPPDSMEVEVATEAIIRRVLGDTQEVGSIKRPIITVSGSASIDLGAEMLELVSGDQVPWMAEDIYEYHEMLRKQKLKAEATLKQ